MDVPLTPLEFARRPRRLHPHREAVVDGDVRLTYDDLFERCDRWSSALQRMGVGRGDRVAYIAPNTHAQLEACSAAPQLGAVLVPINYRLTASDFAAIIAHSGARVVCAQRDHLDAVDAIRTEVPDVERFVALDGVREGWLDYEELLRAARPEFSRPPLSEQDLVTINYSSGIAGGPRGVMITHRNAYVGTVGALLDVPLAVGDRYLWTLPMCQANGWTFVWTVTAAAGVHVCLPRVELAATFELIHRERVG